jgi:hypothetical protein
MRFGGPVGEEIEPNSIFAGSLKTVVYKGRRIVVLENVHPSGADSYAKLRVAPSFSAFFVWRVFSVFHSEGWDSESK